jgi:hypothetical protein
MSITNTIHTPFSHTDVARLVEEEKPKWNEELMSRVTARVREVTGIESGNLPDRVRTWIYRYCTAITAQIEMKPFDQKLSAPIDLDSLPNRSK